MSDIAFSIDFTPAIVAVTAVAVLLLILGARLRRKSNGLGNASIGVALLGLGFAAVLWFLN